jgi:hypothetical protein
MPGGTQATPACPSGRVLASEQRVDSVVGTQCAQAVRCSSCQNVLPLGSFAPRALPRFLTTMTPPTPDSAAARLCLPVGVGFYPRSRVSQVPRPIFQRAPPPITPDSPAGHLLVALLAGDRLRQFRKLGHCQFCVTRPKRVHFIAAHAFAFQGFDARITPNGPTRRSVSYGGERAIATTDSFQSMRLARLSLAHRSHRGRQVRCSGPGDPPRSDFKGA